MVVAGGAQFEMVMSRQALNCLRERLPRLLGDAQKYPLHGALWTDRGTTRDGPSAARP
jgi:hypothetical protein